MEGDRVEVPSSHEGSLLPPATVRPDVCMHRLVVAVSRLADRCVNIGYSDAPPEKASYTRAVLAGTDGSLPGLARASPWHLRRQGERS